MESEEERLRAERDGAEDDDGDVAYEEEGDGNDGRSCRGDLLEEEPSSGEGTDVM